jgi:hypothetical protein
MAHGCNGYFADGETAIPPIIKKTFILRSVTVKESETDDASFGLASL